MCFEWMLSFFSWVDLMGGLGVGDILAEVRVIRVNCLDFGYKELREGWLEYHMLN